VSQINWDSLISKLLNQWGTPGLAVTILDENEIIYSKGFGHRNLEKDLMMTKDTMHIIASCSKSFTSTAIAMLIDEGKLEWNTPIREYLPKFKMKDPVASRQVTITDMLSHRTGLPRHDMVWVDNLFTYDQILERLPHLEVTADIRKNLQYCNLMFIAASIVVEELTGMKFNDFISKRIFKPLEMSNSNFSVNKMRKTENFATPYTIDYQAKEFKLIECEYVVYDTLTGAGSINASTHDVGKWLRFHLNNGRAGKKQLVSPENLRVTYTPGLDATGCPESMKTQLSRYYPEQDWFSMDAWALGWMNQIYRGNKMISHGGALDGSRSLMIFHPHKGIGVNVIVNQSDTFLASATSYTIIDRLLGLDPVDWRDVFEPLESNLHIIIRESKEHSKKLRRENTAPTHDLQEYVGKYHHPGYGVFETFLKDGSLIIKHGTAEYPLVHYHYNTFQYIIARWEFRELLTFQTDSYGDISGVTMKIDEVLPPILFTRYPDDELTETEFFKKLVGTYELAGQVVEIALKGEKILRYIPTGETGIEIQPVRNMRFRSKEPGLFSITFNCDKFGNVNEFLFISHGQVVPAKRTG
jgi:CubicO group peptidase (beta-lactamase class C family)